MRQHYIWCVRVLCLERYAGLQMKESLRGIRFRTVPEILQAVDDSIRTITQQALLKVSYDFHIAGNGLYTMLVTTLKDRETSKHVSILYQL